MALAINLYGYAGGETSLVFFYKKLDSSSFVLICVHVRAISCEMSGKMLM